MPRGGSPFRGTYEVIMNIPFFMLRHAALVGTGVPSPLPSVKAVMKPEAEKTESKPKKSRKKGDAIR